MNEWEERSRNSSPPIGSREHAEIGRVAPGDQAGRSVADLARRLFRRWKARLDRPSDRWGEWARLPDVFRGCLGLVVLTAFVVSVRGTGLA